jgi:hypothetical protein
MAEYAETCSVRSTLSTIKENILKPYKRLSTFHMNEERTERMLIYNSIVSCSDSCEFSGL